MPAIDSLDAALRLSASEAASAAYPEITTAHLLIALARLSEPDVAGHVDGTKLQREFDQLGIEPRRFRRRLRALLGRGAGPPPSGVLHRSPECKAVFEHAKLLAAEEGSSLGLQHLLLAALASLAGSSRRGELDVLECPNCRKVTQISVIDGSCRCSVCGTVLELGRRRPRPPRDDIPVEL